MKKIIFILLLVGCDSDKTLTPERAKDLDQKTAACKTACAPREMAYLTWNNDSCRCKP